MIDKFIETQRIDSFQLLPTAWIVIPAKAGIQAFQPALYTILSAFFNRIGIITKAVSENHSQPLFV